MTVVRMPSKNHSARVDTSRQCCDGRCYQANPSQGGSCPVVDRIPAVDMPSASPVDRAIELVWWVGGVGLLGCLVRACMETPL